MKRPARLLPHALLVALCIPPTLVVAATAADARHGQTSQAASPEDKSATRDDAQQLGRVIVEENVQSIEAARRQLHEVPGGTTLVEAEAFRGGTTSNLEDVLSWVPGVYAAARSGPETHLSIRGSGVSIPWAVKGVRLLRNGLPIVEADGWYHSQLIEPLNVRYVEVYRGANALKYGAATLGGAINLVTWNGYSAPAFLARLEVGPNGYFHPQVASGRALGNGWDYYLSLSSQSSDGFRQHSAGTHDIVYANIGHRNGGASQTRLHVNIADSRQELVGALTRQALHTDLTQGDAGRFISYVDSRSMNKFRRYRFDLQHTRHYGEHGRLDVGLFYGIQDVHHPLPFQRLVKHDLETWGASLRGQYVLRLGGATHHVTWGGLWLQGGSDDREYAPLGGIFGEAVVKPYPPAEPRHVSSAVVTSEVYVQDRFAVAEPLDLVLGAQFAYARRHLNIDPVPTPGVTVLDASYTGFSPKLGLIWEPADRVQLYANLSRSFEPPVLYDFRNSGGSLDAQHATTLEVGTRGRRGLWHWELSLYRARVNDEILSAEEPPGSGRYVTANADDTRHSGAEFALRGRVPLDWVGGDALGVRLAWTWNRLRFHDHASFGDNQLPGLPRRFGHLQVLYEMASGFYIGPSVQTASGYYSDYANTLAADRYTVFGLRAGYRAPHWRVFVEGVNLTDEVYAASTDVINNAGGADSAVFRPGRPRAVFAGVQVQW